METQEKNETNRANHNQQDTGNQFVEVLIRWSLDLELADGNVVGGFVVNREDGIGVFDLLMINGKGKVLRFQDDVRDLG